MMRMDEESLLHNPVPGNLFQHLREKGKLYGSVTTV
jgi:hypothetical protein